MSPKFLEQGGYTFYIYSKEETRAHIHIKDGIKKAKFWIEPTIELAGNYGFKSHEISKIEKIIIENEQYFKVKWSQHFNG